MGDTVKGKRYCAIIGIYMIIKSIVNLLLGFGISNLVWLVVNIALAYALYSQRPFLNYITAAVLVLVFLVNVKTNISGHHWFYLAEGIVDVVCAVMLILNKDIKSCFENNNTKE
ncbi:MAG: hypothetical protein LUI06_08660 [Ruminococcus sp.]|nr:hypothetical protein [Ruminococcus sp.]